MVSKDEPDMKPDSKATSPKEQLGDKHLKSSTPNNTKVQKEQLADVKQFKKLGNQEKVTQMYIAMRQTLEEVKELKQKTNTNSERLKTLEEEIEGAEVYQQQQKFLESRPQSQTKEFWRNLRQNAKGITISKISTIFATSARQAYNIKDRIVEEEEEIAEVPMSGEKNRVVSKKHYLIKNILDDYPALPQNIKETTGKAIGEFEWEALLEYYRQAIEKSNTDKQKEKLQDIAGYFDYEL